jgi:hypothetical protein
MNLLNKILLGFVVVAILPFIAFAAMTLKMHQSWMTPVPKFEKDVQAELDQQVTWEYGDPADATKPGIRKLKIALHNTLTDRGGAWRNCVKGAVGPDGGLSVTIGDPAIASVQDNIKDKAILFVFEERPGGKYLGEFKVSAVNQKQVTLIPALKFSDNEIQDIRNSTGGLTVSDIMPIDRNDILGGMDAGTLQQFIPADSIPEYVRDGQPKADDDDPESVRDGKFVRPLRDYTYLFHYYHHQFSVLSDTKIRAEADKKSIENDQKYLDNQIKKSDEQIVELKAEFARVEKEKAVAAAHFKAVEARLAAVQADVEKTLVANRKLAAQWTAIQTEAARRINEATATAPVGAGRKP